MNRRFLALVLVLIMTLTSTGISVMANEPPQDLYTLTLIVNEGGEVTGGGEYAYGETVYINAIPEDDCIFVCWALEGGVFENQEYAETSFIMPDEDITITAIFQSEDSFAELEAELENIKYINGGEMPDMYLTREDYIPGFINGKYSDVTVSDDDSVIESLYDIKELMFFDDPYEEFEVIKVSEFKNTRYYKLQQLYKGLMVFSRQIIVNTDLNGNIITLSGNYTALYDMPVTPVVDIETAKVIAVIEYGEIITDGELMVYSLDEGTQELAWYFESYS